MNTPIGTNNYNMSYHRQEITLFAYFPIDVGTELHSLESENCTWINVFWRKKFPLAGTHNDRRRYIIGLTDMFGLYVMMESHEYRHNKRDRDRVFSEDVSVAKSFKQEYTQEMVSHQL